MGKLIELESGPASSTAPTMPRLPVTTWYVCGFVPRGIATSIESLRYPVLEPFRGFAQYYEIG